MVEVTSRDGQRIASFAILPMPSLPDTLVQKQYGVALYLARAAPLQFYFLVTSDRTYGWRIGESVPIFVEDTRDLLAKYAGSKQRVFQAKNDFLAALVEAWVGELIAGRGKSHAPIPGEFKLQQLGILDQLRSV